MSDIDVGDCSSDGSCGDDDSGVPMPGSEGKLDGETSLLEASQLALQQFSIGISVTVKPL